MIQNKTILSHVGRHTIFTFFKEFRTDIHFVDSVFDRLNHLLRRNAGTAVKHQRHTNGFVNFIQSSDIQMRLTYIMSVAVSDGNGQGIHMCPFHKILRHLRLGI